MAKFWKAQTSWQVTAINPPVASTPLNEFVYTSNKWIDHCKSEGVEHEFCPRHRHELNGVAERAIQTIGVSFRAMMIQLVGLMMLTQLMPSCTPT